MRYYFHVESAAAMALAAMGDAGIGALVLALADGDRISTPAAEALGEITGELGPRIPEFIDILHSDDSRARESASWLLSRIGDPAVPYLADMLQQSDTPLRVRAAETLRRIDTALARETLAANRR
jgi:HEAT repeat protein